MKIFCKSDHMAFSKNNMLKFDLKSKILHFTDLDNLMSDLKFTLSIFWGHNIAKR